MNLLIFLSDRCNMTCDYCFLDLNRGAATVLDADAASKAVADHLERFGGAARFTILGGEPFVHYPRLKALCEAIRAKSPQAPLSVVTNGTLACPEKMSELARLDVGVTVSLDGRADSHDRHRKLVAGQGSSLAEALKALESCDKSALRANMVVCRDTAGSLLSNVESLREQGFRDVAFHLNVLEPWSDGDLEVLAKALEGFARYYKTLRAATPGALRLSHADSFPESPLEHQYDDLVLGADGRYYPCDGLFARSYKELDRWAVGDARAGVDWKARDGWHRAAREFIHARLERAGHYSCARETYFHAAATGRDADPAVRAFHAADELLGAALAGLRAQEDYAAR
ncbi:MAG: radical SAM protein [Elusimicrobia bacterium]|nr:radical SAM protein [Elusimicrobiota bacterium]